MQNAAKHTRYGVAVSLLAAAMPVGTLFVLAFRRKGHLAGPTMMAGAITDPTHCLPW